MIKFFLKVKFLKLSFKVFFFIKVFFTSNQVN